MESRRRGTLMHVVWGPSVCLPHPPASFLLQSHCRAAHSLSACQIPDVASLGSWECWLGSSPTPAAPSSQPCWWGWVRNCGWQLLGHAVSSGIPVDVAWKTTSKSAPAAFPAVLEKIPTNRMISLLLHGRVFLSNSFSSRALAGSTPVNEEMPGPGSDIKFPPAPGRLLAPRQDSGVSTDNPQ